jgi:hypothetical protein
VLTQLATVKKRVGVADADVTNDAQLTLLIAAVGERFARETGRKLARTVGFQQEFCACCERIGLELYPVEAVTKLEVKCTEAQGWIEVPLTEILVVRSCIVDMRSRLGSTREIGRVTYTGGYVLPGTAVDAGQTALPKDLEWAATEQCAHWWLWRDKVGLYRHSLAGGLEIELRPNELLPQVLGTLKRYERFGA